MAKANKRAIYKGFEIEDDKHTAPWGINGEPLWYATACKEFRKDHFILISVECYATKDRAKIALRREIDMREAAVRGLSKKPKRSLRPSRRRTK